MPEIIIPQRFAQRRGTPAEWAASPSILYEGEIGFELDPATSRTVKWKVGDGVTPWSELPYFGSGGGGSVQMQATATHIQWRASEEAAWEDLIALADLQGPAGEDSTVPGPPGPAVELQVTDDYIQWREEDAPGWTNLIALADLKGNDSTVPGPAGGPTHVLATAGNLTLEAAHNGAFLLHTAGVITCPATAAAGFSTGDIVEVRRQGGTVGFAAGSGAALDYDSSRFGPSIYGMKDVVALKVVATNTWALIGPLADA